MQLFFIGWVEMLMEKYGENALCPQKISDAIHPESCRIYSFGYLNIHVCMPNSPTPKVSKLRLK